MQHPLAGWKPVRLPQTWVVAASLTPRGPVAKTGNGWGKPSKKGRKGGKKSHSGGQKGRKGGKEEGRVDRPNPPGLIRRRGALKVKKEKKEKKEKKVKKRKQKVLLTEDEADDEGAGDETELEDPGHKPLGKDGSFGDGASGSAAAVC